MKILMGEKAAYQGILVPIDNYKFYQEQRLVNDKLREEATLCNSCQCSSLPYYVLAGFIGAGAGFLLAK